MKSNEQYFFETDNVNDGVIQSSVNNVGLTAKEKSILISLTKGNSYKMIGNDCGIAINTVREHIRNIYKKLGVHSCTEAVILALKNEFL